MRILLIVHGLPPSCTGGTETYTLDLACALARRPGLEVGVLAREADPTRPELVVRAERRGQIDVLFVNNTFRSCDAFEDTYRNPALCSAVLPHIEAFGPDVAHVQHVTALSTDLVLALTARDIPVVMTLNDYWPICHRGQLLNRLGQRCDGPGTDGCSECIPAEVLAPPAIWRAARRYTRIASLARGLAVGSRFTQPRSTNALSDTRARHMRRMLEAASVLLAPSDTLEERYRAFGIDAARLRRCEQGIAPGETPPREARRPATPLRVLFAGSLMESKAPGLILDALELLPANAVQVEFVGTVTPYHGDRSYASAMLGRLGDPVVKRYGPAPHHRVADAMRRCDVLVVPSIWIENAPFVIKEAFACGVPVIASRLGGMAELVQDGVNGLLFPPGDARALADALRRIADEPGLLPSLQRGIRPPLSVAVEAANLETLYREQLLSPPRQEPLARSTVPARPRPPRVAAVVLNYGTPDQTFLAARSVQTSTHRADAIIVDNGTGDENTLRSLLPDVLTIATGRNLGFSGGCNVGIRHAIAQGADAVLLLNSDAILEPDALALLVDALRTHPAAGLAAPVVCAQHDPGVVSSAGIAYDCASGRMRHREFGAKRHSLRMPPVREVHAASGCALLVRREVFERCGLLDEPYFFSFEDLEFCLRARASGFTTVCVSAATVLHKGSGTMGARSPQRIYYGVRNHLRLAQQVAPRSVVPRLARAAAIVAYNAAYVVRAPHVRLLAGAAALTQGSFDYVRGRYGR
jgi:GT2 family glycosyltransferase/glycosyltransferase involved in cell wall biosynthesis